jgi:hypothetical protein
MQEMLITGAQMAIWLRKVDLRDVDFAGHELGKQGISQVGQLAGLNLESYYLVNERLHDFRLGA